MSAFGALNAQGDVILRAIISERGPNTRMTNSACRQELWDSGFHLTLGVRTTTAPNMRAGRARYCSTRSIAYLCISLLRLRNFSAASLFKVRVLAARFVNLWLSGMSSAPSCGLDTRRE